MRWNRIAHLVLATSLPLAAVASADHHVTVVAMSHEEGEEKAEVRMPPQPTAGHTMEWNQEQVAGIAQELADAVKDIRGAVRRQPPPNVASMHARAFHNFRDTLRLIENETRSLASRLANGENQEETFPSYRRLWSLVRDARDDARRFQMPKNTHEKIATAREALIRLDAFYD